MAQVKLPPKEIAALKEAQRTLSDQFAEYDKAEECGLDCQEFRRLAQQKIDEISALLKNYS